jgi:hypothetical protein
MCSLPVLSDLIQYGCFLSTRALGVGDCANGPGENLRRFLFTSIRTMGANGKFRILNGDFQLLLVSTLDASRAMSRMNNQHDQTRDVGLGLTIAR